LEKGRSWEEGKGKEEGMEGMGTLPDFT